jgi:hypothetical protein
MEAQSAQAETTGTSRRKAVARGNGMDLPSHEDMPVMDPTRRGYQLMLGGISLDGT